MTETKIPAVYAAIAKVQAHLAKEGISKARRNEQQNYKFRGIDDIYNAMATPMAEAGLIMLPQVKSREVVERTSSKGNQLFYVVLEVEYQFIAVSDASMHTVRVVGEAMDSADKATNKAMSAAQKYAVLQTFCVPTEGDNDADATTHEVAARPQVTRPEPNAANAPSEQLASRIRELVGPKGLGWSKDGSHKWLRMVFGKIAPMELTLGQQQDAIALLEAQVTGERAYEELLAVYRKDGRVLLREKDMGDIFDAANP